jgi:hypothetical protein
MPLASYYDHVMQRLFLLVIGVCVAASVSLGAQWPKMKDPSVPRDAQGAVRYDAPAPRTPDGKIDFSGVWMRANSAAPGRGRGRGGAPGAAGNAAGRAGAPAPGEGIGSGGRGGVSLEPSTNNPDAMCLPMGFLQFHQQPQPRKIYQTPKEILIEYEANYGMRHIYLDGRPLPKQGDPQPFWYGYSVGRWEGDTLVVETNNLRGAEDSDYDGWLDVNGSPYSQQAKFTERFRRVSYGQLQIDTTVEDPKAYTKPWTVRVDQRIMPDEEMIEFICNENQQFRRKVKID